MKIIKYLIISILSILVVFFIIVELFAPKTIMIACENVSIEKPWKKPTEVETKTFKNLITSFNIADCENFYVKDVENGNYILACSKEDKKWDFYWATPKRNDLMGLSDEIKAEITPPE
ncbi:hypothetical protein [Flavobacterium algicola]|uniref:hypothetical protein n=1 Tax=Flavobacterium algicola TaxID=556529 RepID=UPI001EFD4341|nr:hypothetical protein [Flavobacterium algicola]MCG9793269.1 hypothetical protein [Flavobacterium algicola]